MASSLPGASGLSVRMSRASKLGELLVPPRASPRVRQRQVGLGLDVEPGEDEGHGVAPSTQQVDARPSAVGGAGSPGARTRTRSGPSCSSAMVSKRATTSVLG